MLGQPYHYFIIAHLLRWLESINHTRTSADGCSIEPPKGGETHMGLVLLTARILLAVVFLIAGFAKLADLKGSWQSLRDFGVPTFLASPFGVLLPLAELVVAVAL